MVKTYEEGLADAGLEDPPAGLEGWRQHTLDGFNVDLRAAPYHSLDREEVRSMLSAVIEGEHPIIAGFEEEQAAKWGPYSLQDPWSARVEDARDAYFGHKPFRPVPSALNAAIDDFRALIPSQSLLPASVDEILRRGPKTTNLGLPTFSRERRYVPEYVARFDDLDDIFPYVAGWRGQPGGMNPRPWTKQRILDMADKLDGLYGGQMVYPIEDALKFLPEFAAWSGLPAVAVAVRDVLRLARDRGVTVFSTDFSGFDTSIPGELLDIALDIHKSFMVREPWGFDKFREAVTSGALLTPNELWTGRYGYLPSGTITTSVTGTTINRMSAVYISKVLGVDLVAGCYLGDDAVNVYSPQPSVDEIESAGKDFNLDLSADKQFVHESAAHFLQNGYILQDDGELLQGGGIRPIMRMWNGALSFERRRRPGEWNDFMGLVRLINQLENTKFSEVFERNVKFAVEGDGRLLSMDPREILRRAGGVGRINEVLGFAAFQATSWSVSGFDEYRTVQYLRELSGR